MVDGQVGFHRPDNVRRVQVEKNNWIVKALNKTKIEECQPDLYQLQQDRNREIQNELKQERMVQDKKKKMEQDHAKQQREELSYDRIMIQDNMICNTNKATADATAAEEYEDDFFWIARISIL